MSIARYAQKYAQMGLALVPIHIRDKRPIGEEWQQHPITDPRQAAHYFTQHPDHNIGAHLGASRLVSLDLDDLEASTLILGEFGIDVAALVASTPTIVGNPDRRRLQFRAPDVELSRHALTWPRKDEPGKRHAILELRAGNAQDLLPPSIHPLGHAYAWMTTPQGGTFPELPPILLDLWKDWATFKPQAEALCPWATKAPIKLAAQARTRDAGSARVIDAWNAQASLTATLERYGYKRVGNRYLSPHSESKLPGVSLLDETHCYIHHASDPLSSVESGHPVDSFDLFCQHEHGGNVRKAWAAAAQLLGIERVGIVEPSGAVRKPADVPERDWRAGLITTDKGAPKALLANAIHALRAAPPWAGTLGFDAFAGRTCAIAALPFPAALGQWTDTLDILTADWLQHEGIQVNAMVAAQAVETVAKEHPFHPVIDYLDALKWDGVSRIETWLSIYLGAADTPYTRAAGRAWLISAVARVRQPGCKADMSLILEGEQGAMKSTAFDVLGGKWFTDDIEKLGTKDASMQAMSAWIIEMAELDAMTRKVDISAVKAFLSRRSDRFRLPYGKRIIEAPRQCVFCGTVNPGGSGYLHDETGNRRFLPVAIGKIDIDFLRRERDQLWAETSAAYAAGEKWWFTDEKTTQAAKAEQDARREHDVWEGAIEVWLEQQGNPNFVTMVAVLKDALGVEIDRQGKAEQRRAGGCLRALGFEPSWKRHGTDTVRGWRSVTSADAIVS